MPREADWNHYKAGMDYLESGEALHRRGVEFVNDHRLQTRDLIKLAARRQADGRQLTTADVIAAYYDPETGDGCPEYIVPIVKREVAKAAPYLADSCGTRPSERLDRPYMTGDQLYHLDWGAAWPCFSDVLRGADEWPDEW